MLMDFPDLFALEIPHHTVSLPALTTLDLNIRAGIPSPHLITILSSISSAPALDSITLERECFCVDLSYQDSWVDLDRWLTRMAEHTRVQGGLSVILRGWPKGGPSTPGFREGCR